MRKTKGGVDADTINRYCSAFVCHRIYLEFGIEIDKSVSPVTSPWVQRLSVRREERE
jgi:hypothetical protein